MFQVLLVSQNAPAAELRLPGLTFTQIEEPITTAKLDLALAVAETPQGFACRLEYATDLFEAGTVRRFLSHFANLLASAAEDPGRPLAELP